MKTGLIAFFLTILAEIALLSLTDTYVGPGELVILLAVAIGIAVYANRRASIR